MALSTVSPSISTFVPTAQKSVTMNPGIMRFHLFYYTVLDKHPKLLRYSPAT
jgi:hypothetical protein